ncbi:glutathione S-transferase family protein [Sneathiella glossodoripedis]|uniref:glutathione S-transferase family protein n=1 Tax=Sneathiella glossodoripedis TaxID=418853 RepID=UPI00046EA38D|nr:glutathione S-transferase family protein [Sneathiella glossodoripedis]
MKLYDMSGPPSPRRVRVFLAEKGVEIERVEVNIREKAQFNPEFSKLNPRLTIPALELDDGTVLTESEAIQRYIEEVYPDKPLFGDTAQERAIITNWLRIIDIDGYLAVAEAIRNTAPNFENRALTGPRNIAQISDLGKRGIERIGYFFEDLDAQLAKHTYVAGEKYSVADVNALVAVDFAKMAKQSIPSSCSNLLRWHAEVSARPSASA